MLSETRQAVEQEYGCEEQTVFHHDRMLGVGVDSKVKSATLPKAYFNTSARITEVGPPVVHAASQPREVAASTG